MTADPGNPRNVDPRDADPCDVAFMQAALGLARRGLGQVWPNPSVGCVLVRDGRIVARGRTQPSGRPHAETVALYAAGDAARDATAYVTLEPCSHHGRTPPCAEALIAAGVCRVVVACGDPDPRVSGRGLARLRDAGIAVTEGVLESAARALSAGFFLRVTERRPLVTLKLATTLDGRIATAHGESRWITGPEARAVGHRLRFEHDAILVGSGTVLADDPDLTCRLPALEGRSPVRVVADGRLRLPLTARLVRTAATIPTWVVTLPESAASNHGLALRDLGVVPVPVAGDQERLPVAGILTALADRGITRLLVEGGAHLAAALLRERLVDRLEWFRAPSMMGGDGLPGAVGFGIDTLAAMPGFVRTSCQPVGRDLWESYVRA